MIIFDQEGNVIENPDTELGYLAIESMNVTVKWIVDVPSTGHYETIAEYPNGGKDIEWRIDTPEEGHWGVYDESGEIVEHFDGFIPEDWPHEEEHQTTWQFQRYIPYTEEELASIEVAKKQGEIDAIKTKLAETDYVVTKLSELMLTGGSLSEEDAERYSEIIANRQAWRDEINQLESGKEDE